MRLTRRALLLAPVGAPVQAGPPGCGGPYEVGLGISGHLAYEQGATREPAGLLVDLVGELAQRSGLTLRPRCYPLARLVRMHEAAELPLLGLRLWTAERTDIEALLVAAPVLWVHVERAAASLDELLADPAVVFGRLGTGTVSPWVDVRLDALPATRVDVTRDPGALLRMLAVGRVQAVVSMPLMQRAMQVEDYPWHRLHGRSLPEAGTTIGGLQFDTRRICAADADRLRRLLRQLRDDGSLLRLLGKHLGAQAQPWMVWRPALR